MSRRPGTLQFMKRALTWLAPVAALLLPLACTQACTQRAIDLGENVIEKPAPVAQVPGDGGLDRFYGCVAWSDPEVAAVRSPACESECATPEVEASSERHVVVSARDVVAVTAGQWVFCGESPFPGATGAVGMEFTPGCRIYFLLTDNSPTARRYVRGTTEQLQASFDIDVPSSKASPTRIEVLTNDKQLIGFTIASGKCPHNWLNLVRDSDGKVFRLHPAGDVRPEA
jgi:hypothetical protein